MKKTLYLFVVAFTIIGYCNAQLNDYKYMVVPKHFEIFNKANLYQTSTLVKFLYTNNGYTAIYDDYLPEDLRNKGCLALKTELVNNSNLLSTRISIVLKDCNGIIIFTSQEGRSKEKSFKAAYAEAINEAFESFKALDYEYTSKKKANDGPKTSNVENDVKLLEERTIKESVVKTPKPKIEKELETLDGNTKSTVLSDVKDKVNATKEVKQLSETLYAQPIENGFQLVDTSPKVKFIMKETLVPNVYVLNNCPTSGIVFKKDDKWFLQYANDKKESVRELNIKF